MSTTRRIYFYLVTLIALGILTSGIGQLLSLIFDVIFRNTTITHVGGEAFQIEQFSLGLAMILIAGPLWFFFWRSIQKRITGNPEEIGSAIRKLFLNLVLIITIFIALGTTGPSLRWLLDGAQLAYFPSGELATLIVTTVIWFFHWQLSEKEGHPSSAAKTLRRWYVYMLSGAGLVWLSTGIVQLISTTALFLPFWGDEIAHGEFWSNTTQSGIAGILIGGIGWYFHWFRMARGDIESVLRQVYFYLLAISGGAIAALVALTITIYQFLKWILGTVTVSGGQHFQFLGWPLPTLLIGIAIWGYHRQLVQEEQTQVVERRLSAQRVHLYLMSFLGLGTLVTGLMYLSGILLGLIIGSVGTSIAESHGGWKDPLSLCLALLIVGTPLWLYFWGKVLKLAEKGGVTEWRARSRRIFLYVVVGASIVALVTALVYIVYRVLNGLLQGDFGVQVLRNIRWSLQILIVATPLLWYHWRIIRTDQRRGAEAVAARKTVTLVASDPTGELTSRLTQKLGYKIRVLYPVSPADEETTLVSDEEMLQAITSVQNAPSTTVLLVALGGKITVLPYREK
jgi:ABC-type multidrug transport system fused ATPase/permease subunit